MSLITCNLILLPLGTRRCVALSNHHMPPNRLACLPTCLSVPPAHTGYEEEEYKGGYKGEEYKGEEYKDKEYKDKEYDEEYSKYNYYYKKRDNPPDWKPYQEGPPGYNPKAYENYEYDRYAGWAAPDVRRQCRHACLVSGLVLPSTSISWQAVL